MTQQELADRTKVSRTTVAKYETADGGYESTTIASLAKALGVDELDLVTVSPHSGDRHTLDDCYQAIGNALKDQSVIP